MKYTFRTIGYMVKNFFYVFPLVLLPAFFLALTVARGDIVTASEKLFAGNYDAITFMEVFQAVSIFNFSSAGTVFAGLAGVVALVVCVSLLMAFIDKHMRFGKRTFNGLFGKLNDNLVSTFGLTFILVVIYEIWTVILAALLTLCLLVKGVLAVVLASIVFILMHFALTYAITFWYLWLPCMQITGFRTFEALRYGYLLCEPIHTRIALAQAGSLILAELAITATTLFLPGAWSVSVLVTTLLYAMMILLFCVRMQIVYFDREQIEREDLKRYYDV